MNISVQQLQNSRNRATFALGAATTVGNLNLKEEESLHPFYDSKVCDKLQKLDKKLIFASDMIHDTLNVIQKLDINSNNQLNAEQKTKTPAKNSENDFGKIHKNPI